MVEVRFACAPVIEGVKCTLDGEVKYTDEQGLAYFYGVSQGSHTYSVEKDGMELNLEECHDPNGRPLYESGTVEIEWDGWPWPEEAAFVLTFTWRPIMDMNTIVIYNSKPEGDTRSAELIAETFGFTLHPITGEEPPGPIFEESNLVLVGGPIANPYSVYYFPEITGEFICGAEPPHVIETKKRANDTVLVLVAGCGEEDTWAAAREFCGVKGIELVGKIGLGVASAALAGLVFDSARRR